MPATTRSERREAEDEHRERVKPGLAMAEEEQHEGDVDRRACDDDLVSRWPDLRIHRRVPNRRRPTRAAPMRTAVPSIQNPTS